MTTRKEGGFHLLISLVVLAVVAAIGFVGYMVFTKDNKSDGEVLWSFNEQSNEWEVSQGTAPACPEPMKFDNSPVDMSHATAVLFPGTYRGKSYKVHGGFGFDSSQTVVMPMDGTLTGLVRYYEGNPLELQYKVDFENDCGISFYFDHLHTLSPELQKIAEQTPEPKVDDTSDVYNGPHIKMKAGGVVATETGAHKVQRYGIDFGVVDYRQRNEISKNSTWATMHNEYETTEWYGVCWFDMMPDADVEKVKQLSRLQLDTRRVAQHVSDYCDNADYTTLDFNDGKPVDYY